MIIMDIALMALISAAIVGLLVWSIFTQHRHFGCEDLRFDRRPRIRVSVATRQDVQHALGAATHGRVAPQS